MLVPSLLLAILGVVAIFSSSPSLAISQAIFIVLGLGVYFGLSYIDYRTIQSLIRPSYILILILLVIVFLIGYETRGSVRWIPLGLFNLQPSEFAKPVLILCLAAFWTKHLPTWKNIFLSLLIILPVAALIFKQPDLGTTLTVLFIWVSMLIASNISFAKLSLLGVLTLAIAPLGWFTLKSYQKQRFVSFLSPQNDPQGVGYNVIQSTIAVGSGELTGRGLGRGTQSHLQFLPEFRTDFIFASITEELGLLGSLIVMTLYVAIFIFLFRILSRSSDRFGELITVGVSTMLFIQIVINIGMNTGLLPVTGITLPLLSYGGSSVLTIMMALGLVGSVGRFGVKRKSDIDTSIR